MFINLRLSFGESFNKFVFFGMKAITFISEFNSLILATFFPFIVIFLPFLLKVISMRFVELLSLISAKILAKPVSFLIKSLTSDVLKDLVKDKKYIASRMFVFPSAFSP